MKKLALVTQCIALFFVFIVPIGAAQARADLAAYQIEQNRVIFTLTDNSKVRVSLLDYAGVEVVYNAQRKQLPSFALAQPEQVQKPVENEHTDAFEFTHGPVAVKATKKPFSLSFHYLGEPRTAEEIGYFNVNNLHGFRFTLASDEKLYGGGQRVLGMNRRGHRMPLYNRAHYGYTTESKQMYYSLPAVMSSHNYAIVFDNTAKGNLDIGYAQTDVLQFDAQAGRAAYLVVMGKNTSEVSTNLVSLTGRQPLPPRWALGNFASRFGYRNEQQTRDVVQRFQQADIPLDVVVLDLYWFGKDVKGHMGNLAWDKNSFPQPEKMLADLHQQGIKTVVITEPFILTTSSQFENAVQAGALAQSLNGETKTFDFFFGNTGLVDVFSEQGQAWFTQFYQQLHEQGVAGWWGDLGEPEVHPYDTIHYFNEQPYTGDALHNAYGHQWAAMVYNQSLTMAPEQRPFVLMRSGFMGSQRFGMIPWTGDVSRSWGGLQPQVELSLQMGIFGLAYTHSDLGGFAGGEMFDPELYLRWLQLGVFQPVFRPHAQEDIAPEPVFHDDITIERARALINLRYKMLPYNNSLAITNSLTGLPFMRPMSFYHSEPEWFANSDQFYWGEQLLIAPITEPKVTTWQVTLPDGMWYDLFSDQRYQGGSNVAVPVSATTFPVFLKAGAIIPTIAPASNTEQADFANLNIHLWVDPTAIKHGYTYYEDDGKSPNSITHNEIVKAQITQHTTLDSTTIGLSWQGSYPTMPTTRQLNWLVHGLNNRPSEVVINGQTYKVSQYEEAPKYDLASSFSGVSVSDTVLVRWQSRNQTLHIAVGSDYQQQTITIR